MTLGAAYYRLCFPMRPGLKLGGELWKHLVLLEVRPVLAGNVIIGENVIAHLKDTSAN